MRLSAILCLLAFPVLAPVSKAFSQEDEAGTLGKIAPEYTSQIDQLAKSKKIQVAFQSITAQNKRNREDLIMLTEIAAPPFMESKRAQRFKEMLKQAGADSVWIDKEGNVVALRKGKNTRVGSSWSLLF
jgi:tripeptide aminopeptidase